MALNEENRPSQLNLLKNRILADLPKEVRQPSRDQANRGSNEERPLRYGSSARHQEADYDSAYRLVQRASDAIDALQDRCRRLEADLRDLNERLKSEAESSERVIKDWERLATALKNQLTNTDASLSETQSKLDAAEHRATALEALAKSTEERANSIEARHQAAEARAKTAEQLAAHECEIASNFRDSIFETFGTGSRLSTALSIEPGE